MYLLAVFLPLINVIFAMFWSSSVKSIFVIYIIIILMGLGVILSNILFYEVCMSSISTEIIGFKWIHSGYLEVNWGFYFDNISVSMIWLVLTISFLVHIYSYKYMEDDPYRLRFLALLSLLLFSCCF